MDEEVRSLLVAWNLEEYLDVFKENKITSLSLPLLGESEIKELLPRVGPRTVFIRNMEVYKKTMNLDLSTAIIDDDRDLNDLSLGGLIPFPLDNSGTSALTNPEITTPERNASPSQLPVTSSPISRSPVTIFVPNAPIPQIIELKHLLNTTLEGKGLLNWDKTIPLDNAARQRLVRIIGTCILHNNPEEVIRTSIYANWAQEICRVFPKEKVAVYFHSKIVESTRGLVTRLAGKLPDQIHNLKRKYKETGVIQKRPRISRSSSPVSPSPSLRLPAGLNCEDEEDVEENLLWLKSSSEPWNMVMEKWTQTIHTRLSRSKDLLISLYFKEYPALQKPTGYLLLEKDFDLLYTGQFTDIVESFPLLKQKIFDEAKKRSMNSSKDKNLNSLITFENSSEETANIACMLLIPSLLNVASIRLKITKKKFWRPSKAEVRDGFITHVKNDSDVKTAVSNRRDKFKELGLTVQPFIIIVGTSLDEIKTYFVVIDEIFYVLPNILAAVRTCFKLIWVVNAKYPTECYSTWMFIQSAFFKFKTKYDSSSTATHTLLALLGIDND